MESRTNNALFSSALWERALESYASAAHLTVKLFDADARVVFGPIHPTPFFQLFESTTGYEPGLFDQCARRCLAQTNARHAVMVSEFCGLSVVGTSLVLDGKIVGAAVGGYAFVDFAQWSEVQRLAQNSGISFERLWRVAREQKPVPQQRLVLDGELLQVLGDALLRENYRTRQYEQIVLTLQETVREKDQAQEEIRADLCALTRMHTLSSKRVSECGLQPLLQDVMDATVAIMAADKGALQILERDELRIVAHHGCDDAFLEFSANAGIVPSTWDEARKCGERVVVEDAEQNPIFAGTPFVAALREAGVRAIQSTPLIARGGRLLGILSTHWSVPHLPDERDLWRLDLLVRQAADLIESTEAESTNLLLASIVQSSVDAIISKDLNGLITSWNRGAEHMFGYSAEEMIGQTISVLIPEGLINDAHVCLERVKRGETIEPYETVRRAKSGNLLTVSISWSSIHDANGRIVGASKVVHDITERKQMAEQQMELLAKERALASERALREVEAELARVVRALSVGELATSIAHEINQPLAGIVTNAEAGLRWLGNEIPNIPETRESLALIARDGNRASAVIRRIREFLSKETPQHTSLDLNEVVQEAVDIAYAEVQKRGIVLHLDLDRELPGVRGDRIQLQQVILNLVLNAADSMTSVEWRKELLVTSARSADSCVVVAVRDSGVGISLNDMSQMFNAFFTTKPTGIGMGLSVSRSIIEAHGGRIWATINEGPGITVHFDLPIEADEAQ